jgi:hypothetical protein
MTELENHVMLYDLRYRKTSADVYARIKWHISQFYGTGMRSYLATLLTTNPKIKHP